MKKTIDFSSGELLDLQHYIDKYYGISVDDIFKINDMLLDYSNYGFIIKRKKENITIFEGKKGKEKILIEYFGDNLKICMTSDWWKREIIRSVDSRGNIQIVATKTEDTYRKNLLTTQKVAGSQIYGKITYSPDGTFIEQRIIKCTRCPELDYEEDVWYDNYTEEEVITNIENRELIKKYEMVKYFNPSENALRFSYTTFDDISGVMDSKRQIKGLITNWCGLTSEEYMNLMSQTLGKKPKIIKIDGNKKY